jgi:uncharacterized protein (DUF362 family)/Pyruvate/2-oxoacid:ferredoxin oxidoreductase delta subunit
MARVLIHPATYDTVQEAVECVFSLFPVDIKGKKVLIKPNVLRASKATEAIVTHPALLGAVVEKIESMKPATLVVGDNPGLFNYGANEESFRSTGLMAAARGYYRNIGTDADAMDFNPDFMATVSISRAVLEADVIISLPKFKTHGLTIITGAIKNSYGFLPGAQKAVLHRIAGNPERFNDLIVDVFRLRVPDLFIMDAVVGMEGNGPASPDLREIGLVLAADNAVAMDTVVATMMGCAPRRLRFLQGAEAAGLGEPDLAAIDIIGELVPLSDFKLPPMGGEAIQNNPAIQELIDTRSHMRPHADPDFCTACGLCVEQCPVSALTLKDGLPTVDADTCITCFCCQEMCPEKAMALG